MNENNFMRVDDVARELGILLSAPSSLALAWMNSFRSLYGSTLTQS